MRILHEATCDNYFELSYLLITNYLLIVSGLLIWFNAILEQISRKKLLVLTLPGYVLYFLTALYFHISIRIFCNLFICLVFDGLLQSICFQMFFSKHSITFGKYLLSCQFQSVDIFYIKFRSCETLTITNSGAILLLIGTLSNFRTMKC